MRLGDLVVRLRGKTCNARKQPHGGSGKASGPKDHYWHSNCTAAGLEKRFGVSSSPIRRDGKFAEAVDRIDEVCRKDARQMILSGQHRLTPEYILELAELDAAVMKDALQQRLGEGHKP